MHYIKMSEQFKLFSQAAGKYYNSPIIFLARSTPELENPATLICKIGNLFDIGEPERASPLGAFMGFLILNE